MITALKNASMASKPVIEVMHTNNCESIAKLLERTGFLAEVKTFKPKGTSVKRLSLTLANGADGSFKLTNTKLYTKPSRRIYVKSSELMPVSGGYGVVVVSTPQGYMTGSEAKKKNLGGELICKVF